MRVSQRGVGVGIGGQTKPPSPSLNPASQRHRKASNCLCTEKQSVDATARAASGNAGETNGYYDGLWQRLTHKVAPSAP